MEQGFISQQPLKSISLEATVIRANGDVEELGTVAYWHRNPLKRLVSRLRGRGPITQRALPAEFADLGGQP